MEQVAGEVGKLRNCSKMKCLKSARRVFNKIRKQAERGNVVDPAQNDVLKNLMNTELKEKRLALVAAKNAAGTPP